VPYIGLFELLRAVARPCLAAGQGELDLDLKPAQSARQGAGSVSPITVVARMGHLHDAWRTATK
jgi:hypothetical protein